MENSPNPNQSEPIRTNPSPKDEEIRTYPNLSEAGEPAKTPISEPIRTYPTLSEAIRAFRFFFKPQAYFLPYQIAWIRDNSPLKIIQKCRRAGISYAESYAKVKRVSRRGAKWDVWVSSRDETQAKLFLEDCKYWAKLLHLIATDLGEIVVDDRKSASAHTLQFANGKRIYCLSSNPDALAGKGGDVVLDEFALHEDQRLLYRVAKPVTTWGGQLSIISTHRGANSLFNQIIRDIMEKKNRMGWSLHTVPLLKAVEQGLVKRINEKTGANESDEEFLARTHSECIDEDQWKQEYCCQPGDEASAFLTYDILQPCLAEDCLKDFNYLRQCKNPLWLGMDFARVRDLTVIDVGEQIGDVVWDRMRIELHNTSYDEQEAVLYPLLALPNLRRACIDAGSWGNHLAERAHIKFGWKVEKIIFTNTIKEQLAYGLRAAFKDRKLRIDSDPKLLDDLRGIKKEVTASGNIRLDGNCDDSHCDRFWAKALRQHALSTNQGGIGAMVVW